MIYSSFFWSIQSYTLIVFYQIEKEQATNLKISTLIREQAVKPSNSQDQRRSHRSIQEQAYLSESKVKTFKEKNHMINFLCKKSIRDCTPLHYKSIKSNFVSLFSSLFSDNNLCVTITHLFLSPSPIFLAMRVWKSIQYITSWSIKKLPRRRVLEVVVE